MTPREVVRQFVDGINARDVPRLATLMTPDHRFVDSLGSVLVGRVAVQEGWRQYFQMVPDYHIDVHQFFSDGPDVILVGTAGGTYSRGGQLRPGDAWQTPAAWRAVVRDEAVAEWQVYADNEPVRQRMTGASA